VEAEELYLSKNLFVLPDFFNTKEPFVRPQQAPVSNTGRPLFSKNAKRFLKNIRISFNSRPRNSGMVRHVAWEVMGQASLGRGFITMSQRNRQDLVHGWTTKWLTDSWLGKTWDLIQFLSVEVLEHLEVDLTSAYCPFACCRPHGECLADELVYEKRPARLTFLGMMDGEEKNMLVGIKACLDTEHTVGPRLSQKSDQEQTQHRVRPGPGCMGNMEITAWR
jgi:hypothetical protein